MRVADTSSSDSMSLWLRGRRPSRVRKVSDRVLYFPYMRVPKDEWFTRALLYWDDISIIVPNASTDSRLGWTDNYTRTLVSQGFVQVIDPEDVDVPRIAGGFRQLLTDGTILPRTNSDQPTISLHVSKMGLGLLEEMREMGLAVASDQAKRGFWYEVAADIGHLYMAFLATAIGATRDLAPVTDDADGLKSLDGLASRSIDRKRTDRLELVLLDSILPAPSRAISLDELRRFKDQHRESLVALRKRLETETLGLISEPDRDVRNRRLASIGAELSDSTNAIVNEMSRRRWPSVAVGGFGFIGSFPAAAATAAAAASGDLVGLTLNGAGFVAAVATAIGGLRPNRDLAVSPLAYAAIARRRFGKLSHEAAATVEGTH